MLENYNHVLFEIKKKSDFHGGESVRALEMGKLWCWWRLMLSHSVRAHEWTANTRRLGQPPRLEGRPPAWGTWLDQRRIVATRAHLSSRMQSVTTAASRQATEACSLHWAIIKKKADYWKGIHSYGCWLRAIAPLQHHHLHKTPLAFISHAEQI